jgi:hypothetical protein
MSHLMLSDKNAMDDINPFTDPENFFPPGTSKHTLDFKKYKAPVQEEQEEYVSPACDMLTKGVGRLGFRKDECALSRPLLPGRNIDRGFTVKEKIEMKNEVANTMTDDTKMYKSLVSIACLLLLIAVL